MPREEKAPKLKPVDETPPSTTPVYRLQNAATDVRAKAVKLPEQPQQPAEVSERLTLPSKDNVEARSHQPDIESIIDTKKTESESPEENWGSDDVKKRPVPWGWFALLGLAIAGSVLWSITKVGEADDHVSRIRQETASSLVDEQREIREATSLVESLETTISSFFNASSPSELLPLIRQPDRVAPLIEDHYSRNPFHHSPLASVDSLTPLTLENRANFWVANVSLQNNRKSQIILETSDSAPPKVDWETFVCYQPMSWDEYVTTRPKGTTLDFRVYLKPDNLFSHEFRDSSKWLCCLLTTRDSDNFLFGYMKAESPVATQIKRLYHANKSGQLSAILRLQLPEDLKSPSGVIIRELLSPRWIYVDPPDAGS